jgi:hypothetical protein
MRLIINIHLHGLDPPLDADALRAMTTTAQAIFLPFLDAAGGAVRASHFDTGDQFIAWVLELPDALARPA